MTLAGTIIVCTLCLGYLLYGIAKQLDAINSKLRDIERRIADAHNSK
jgi:hypothetical protein